MTKQYSIDNRMVVDSEWAKEPASVHICEGCRGDIYAGEYAYHFDGWWHEDCFEEHMRKEYLEEVQDE